MNSQTSIYQIEALAKHHDKNFFYCGVSALDQYLYKLASQDVRKCIAATFVLTKKNDREVLGFYTLSSFAVNLGELPRKISKQLPKYPMLPATLLGRLAVTKKYQSKGLGKLLLVDALYRIVNVSKEIGTMAVVVEAKDETALAFYKHYGFIELSMQKNKLFLPLATISRVCL